MEALGAAAAAMQLASVAIYLQSLITRIRDAKDTMQKRSQQVETLIVIASAIKDKKQLQTPEIHGAVQRCLKEAETLKTVLAGPRDTAKILERMRNVVGGLIMEKKIEEIMIRLEREKNTLVLCISTIDSYIPISPLLVFSKDPTYLQEPLAWNQYQTLCHANWNPARFPSDGRAIATDKNSDRTPRGKLVFHRRNQFH
jgi:hypothetical protein